MKYLINALIWMVFAAIGAYVLNSIEYAMAALVISQLWYMAALVVEDLKA